MEHFTIYIDGGSRGNPGPAGAGILFVDQKGKILKKYFQFLGQKTNNEAEYLALIFALKKAKLLLGKEKIKKALIEIKSDSQLLIKQINGQYKIKEPGIQKLFIEVWNLKIDFPNLKFVLIPREENKEADRLSNLAYEAYCS